ncbi:MULTISPECIES: response regulator transcription factor [Actinosynnema]|uniref:response regulator n=1 Tax=Actinosynnema TaxID=40566 RepID=UPI0020A4C95A|nr:response regulator transcription factor [Actinosynnema pretiosum]MCP2094917.1 two component transcriptional regulator, LuxR family [Actinosynnema pretiosum]
MSAVGQPVRVVIVDDQPLIRAGLGMVLGAQEDIEVVGEAENGARALEVLSAVRADVVIMDIRMPVLDGVETTRRLCARADSPKVLVLTTFDTDEDAFAALQAGASGFLLKNSPPEDTLNAIRVIAAGDAVVAPRVTRRLLDRFAGRLDTARAPRDDRLDALTEREREVLVLVARGLSNVELAERMHVAEATVKTHLGRVLTKLGLRDRVQAVVLAYELGLVRPGE